MSIKIFIPFIILINSFALLGQELDVKVTVDAPQLTTADKKVTEEIRVSVEDFLNNTVWTDNEFEKEEKIKANLNIKITEDPSTTEFTADFTLQSERPVFNSTYSTVLTNFRDNNIAFTYVTQQNIEKATSSYYDHLSAILTMYAYTILAYDYDSFSQFGGDEYFNKVQDVINTIPGSLKESNTWNLEGKNNRAVMASNMLNSKYRPYRQAFYEFHRMGLDLMHDDSDKAKAIMVSNLNTINDVNNVDYNSTAIQMFSDAKRSEIIEIFKMSAKGQQKKVYDIMVKLDPSQASKYHVLK